MPAIRDERFDIVKCIAMFFVVFGHVLTQLDLPMLGIVYFTHMPVFFFVSGFFHYGSLSRHDMGTLLIGKGKPLLMPYVCWSVVAFLTNALMMLLRGGYLLRRSSRCLYEPSLRGNPCGSSSYCSTARFC